MLNKKKDFFILIVIIITSIYIGYENPKIVDIPKSIIKQPKLYYKFFLNKIGLGDDIFLRENKLSQSDLVLKNEKYNQNDEIKLNSFSLVLEKVKSFPEKAVSVIMDTNENKEVEYNIFTQDGFIIQKDEKTQIDLPLFYYQKQDGGIRSVIGIENEYYALMSMKKFQCLYVSLVDLKNRKELIKSKCLINPKGADFGGIGGAYAILDDKILLTIGAPEHNAPDIAELSQSKDTIFGKILSINKKSLLNYNNKQVDYKIFSIGHRNPQGLVYKNNKIFSLEHGPQGGDELNKIIEGKNYGWPIVSFGTKYNDGKSYLKNKNDFIAPIFTFIPAVAPTSLNKCPIELANYYKNNNCLMGLSLRAMSILIFLLDNNTDAVINVERVFLDKRLRQFGLDKAGNLFFDKENFFYISSEKDGLYKAKFINFR